MAWLFDDGEAQSRKNDDAPRSGRARAAGELVGDVGGRRSSASVSSRRDRQPLGRNRRRALCRGFLAGIDPLPGRPQIGRRADPAGRGRPCSADAASGPADHRTGQPLLRLCGGRPDGLSSGPAAGAAGASSTGPSFAPCPRNLAKACAKLPTRASRLPGSACGAELTRAMGRRRVDAPKRRPSRHHPERMTDEATHCPGRAAAVLAIAACNAEKKGRCRDHGAGRGQAGRRRRQAATGPRS